MNNHISHLNKILDNLKDHVFVCHGGWVNKRLAERNVTYGDIKCVSDSDTLLSVVKMWDFPKEMDLFYLVGKVAMLEEVLTVINKTQKQTRKSVKKRVLGNI